MPIQFNVDHSNRWPCEPSEAECHAWISSLSIGQQWKVTTHYRAIYIQPCTKRTLDHVLFSKESKEKSNMTDSLQVKQWNKRDSAQINPVYRTVSARTPSVLTNWNRLFTPLDLVNSIQEKETAPTTWRASSRRACSFLLFSRNACHIWSRKCHSQGFPFLLESSSLNDDERFWNPCFDPRHNGKNKEILRRYIFCFPADIFYFICVVLKASRHLFGHRFSFVGWDEPSPAYGYGAIHFTPV